MNKMWYLLKVQLLASFGINKIRYEQDPAKKKKLVGMGIIFLFVFIMCVAMSVGYNYGLLFTLVNWQLESLYLPLIMMVTSFIVFFTTLYKVNGLLFGFKDYDMIMVLPIKTSQIIATRIILLYSMNFLFLCVVMIPAAIVYSLMITTTVTFWIKYIISLFFIPFIPLIAGAVIGSIITIIASRSKHTSLITTLLSIGAICLIMIGTSASTKVAEDVLENLDLIKDALQNLVSRIYPLASLYGQGVCENNLLAFVGFIGISLVAFIVFVSLLGVKFKAIHTRLTTTKMNKDYKLGELKDTTPLMALYQKELKRYFSSSIYVVNTGIGSILLLLFAGSLCFVSPEQMESALEMPNFSQYLNQFAPLIMAGFMVLTCTTASSISLEGKNLWILKSLPVHTRHIFLSKLFIHLIVTIPSIIISGIIMVIVLHTNLIQSILIFVVPLIYTVFIGILGLIVNVKYPRFDWNNEVEVVKQGLATLIVMACGALVLFISVGIILVIPGLNNEWKMLILTLGMGVLTLLAYGYMNTKSVEAFKNLK